jgi:hypothetical protein
MVYLSSRAQVPRFSLASTIVDKIIHAEQLALTLWKGNLGHSTGFARHDIVSSMESAMATAPLEPKEGGCAAGRISTRVKMTDVRMTDVRVEGEKLASDVAEQRKKAAAYYMRSMGSRNRVRQKCDPAMDTRTLLNQALAALVGFVASCAQSSAAVTDAGPKSTSAAR